MRDLGLDFRHAVRVLRAAPASTLSAIATLALGVGLTTSIFSVVNGVVLRPLPFPHEDQLVNVCERSPKMPKDWCGISPPDLEDLADRSHSFEALGLGRGWPYHLFTAGGAEGVDGGLATPGLFKALGAKAERGRLIEDADLIGRASSVALVSHEMWQSRFASRPDIIGLVVQLDGDPVTIVGVIEPGFAPPLIGARELWRPLHINPRDEHNREWSGFTGFERLREGVTIDAAKRELDGIATQLRAEHFSSIQGWRMDMVSTRDIVIGNVRPMLFMFLGAVLVVLLIGCANVANLLLARASSRGMEMALRAALGASPGRIARGLLTESMILALVGGGAGVLLSLGATKMFKVLAPPNLPRIDEVAVDGRVLAFALVLAVSTTFVFGLVPAIRGSRVDLAKSLREGGRGSGKSKSKFGSILVGTELALAVALVASAGLLTRSFVTLMSWRPGFEQEHLLIFNLFVPDTKYKGEAAVASLWRRMEPELASIPGVVSVATGSAGPLFGGRETYEMEIEHAGIRSREAVRWYDASPDYFATFGIPIVRGRPLLETDNSLDGPFPGVINETAAKRLWPNEDPLGKTLTFTMGKDRVLFTVVGVARDVSSMRPDEPVEPQLWWSNRQLPRVFTYFIIRSKVPPASLAATIRSRVRAFDKDFDPQNFTTLPERMHRQLTTPRFTMLLVAIFGLAALFFAAIGTYGLLSYFVSQRTREIGIRLALGAAPSRILGSIVRGGLALALPGIASGLLLTLLAGRVMRSLVVGVSVSDPLTLIGASIVLLLVATAACFLPAWKASRVDPAVTLSAE